MWFIGVEVEQETSAPPPKRNPGSAPVIPDFSASGCKHFGGQQSFTSYRVTSNTVEVPEFDALE